MSMTMAIDRAGLRDHITAWRADGLTVALVPTMGALHAGHMRLIEAAKAVADRVVVTIFVNPTQFAPTEDFASYPRDIEADGARVAAAGGDLVYAPALPEMYPPGFATSVEVAGPATAGLEDRFRPGHFAGVATIVAKLLFQARPDIAVFGEKDFQQLRVIQRTVVDLDMSIGIQGVPVVREADGLAMSSRNTYLAHDERVRAPALYEALASAAVGIVHGVDPEYAVAVAKASIQHAGFVIDYVEARESIDLGPFVPGKPGRILAAARLGRTRLIDTVPIGCNSNREERVADDPCFGVLS